MYKIIKASLRCLGLLLIFGCSLFQSSALEVIRGPYLQSGTPRSLVVRWRTDLPADSLVKYGTSSTNLAFTASNGTVTRDHEVALTNLLPVTRYYYSIGSSETELASGSDYYFRTGPEGTRSTRMWVVGDSGTADSNAEAVRDAFLALNGTRHIDLWLMLGDNAYYTGTDNEYQRAVFDMYPEVLRRCVLWPTIGNHDAYTASLPYLDIFTLPTQGEAGGVPSGSERYYSFNHANIHFVCLDSMTVDRSSNGPMCLWLREDLAANTNNWVIAFWHHPPYSKGSHNSDTEGELMEMRGQVLPILESYGVDLVLCGHSHSYERSYMLNGHYGSSSTLQPEMIKDGGNGRMNGTGAYYKGAATNEPYTGTVYVVAGSSGLTTPGNLNHPVMFHSTNELGSLIIDVDGQQMDVRFAQVNPELGTFGVTDYFTMIKGTNVALKIVNFRYSTNQVSVGWNSIPARNYRVEQESIVGPGHWKPVSSVITARSAGTSWSILPEKDVTNSFYRVVELPPPVSK